MRRLAILIAVAPVLHLVPAHAASQNEPVPFVTNLNFPTNMAFAPDGRLFFTERTTGDVRVVSASGALRPEPFLHVDVDASSSETGLLGIALNPGFPREPWMYLYYSDAATRTNVLARVRADETRGGEPERLLTALTSANGYHNGGDLAFGQDGMLYVSVGEVHESERAQNVNDIGGKILRFASDGSVPSDNPFGPDNPAFTYGHRNSFGLCTAPDGTMYETENGPDVDDEVNRLDPGANYGWPTVTGFDDQERFTQPLAVLHDTVALTGCAWWHGTLYVGSFVDSEVRAVTPSSQGPWSLRQVAQLPAGVTDLEVGKDGRLYIAAADGIYVLNRDASTGEAPSSEPGGNTVPAWRAWIAIGATLLLMIGLVLRFRAGRRLRRERLEPDADD